MQGKNSKMRKAVAVSMVVVTAVTVFIVRDFTKQAQAKSQTYAQPLMQPSLWDENLSRESDANGLLERTEADYAAVQDYVRRYAGEWNVEKYFDGEQWKIYELGKRMAIVAYNFLNDVSFTTGGYDKFVGYDPIIRTTIIEETGEEIDSELVGFTPKYEYVPQKHYEFHGTDIEYSTPSIAISDGAINMNGFGGPIFSLELFRLETIDGQEYLINDAFRFAITFDGKYIEYCEPDTYGHYQGYYAFQ